ncbi:MAG: tRNA (adenosine(37)-N6)-dimethylallyltransferase MiaA [Melioribacter sp.]|nr:tRNA (adenosine(37)-N6)-dimethylallyltransferase MiaA [Melioribacter sp.]
MERQVIVIVGPTCSGKTKVSIELAKKLNSEIISADSRQIYMYLDIGTAKPLNEDLETVKHHFINYLYPDENYNVSRFENDALEKIEKLFHNNKIPIVAGGSGLYIHAIVDGIFDAVNADDEFREEFNLKREKFGNEYWYEELKKVDPLSASEMLPQNWKRVMRALEVYHLSGQQIWKFQRDYKRETNINFIQFGIEWPREILYDNINNRVVTMISNGLVDEVKSILNAGYNSNLNSLNTVGYKEIISYLQNEISLDRAVELIKRNTRHYAKRQLTWFRKDKRIHWIKIQSGEQLKEIPDYIINHISNLK